MPTVQDRMKMFDKANLGKAPAPAKSKPPKPLPMKELRPSDGHVGAGGLEAELSLDDAKREAHRRRVYTVVVLGLLIIALTAIVVIIYRSVASSSKEAASGTRKRLRIRNGCAADPLWIASTLGPYKLAAGATHAYDIPDVGLAATRFWPKWGCNEAGQDCVVGQSGGGQGENCPKAGCAPPVDSKFEATFGCMPGTDNCAVNPSKPSERLGETDWWDVSQVDGWTLPYKVEASDECKGRAKTLVIDCSHLDLSSCPTAEDLGLNIGSESLRLKHTATGKVVGCYSPCAKLTYRQWSQGHHYAPESAEARDYCCPTPPISSEKCSAGPVTRTKFVAAVHRLCPSVYAYAYDDGVGLSQCPVGTTFTVTFYCPK